MTKDPLPPLYTHVIGSLPRPLVVRELLSKRPELPADRFQGVMDEMGIGLGVVDVRGGRLQTVEDIETLAAAGIEQVGAGRVALNPDCGFAPDAGVPPTIDEAFEKLRRLSSAAALLRVRYCGA